MLIMVVAVAALASNSVSALTLQEGAEAARCDECPRDLFGDNGVRVFAVGIRREKDSLVRKEIGLESNG